MQRGCREFRTRNAVVVASHPLGGHIQSEGVQPGPRDGFQPRIGGIKHVTDLVQVQNHPVGSIAVPHKRNQRVFHKRRSGCREFLVYELRAFLALLGVGDGCEGLAGGVDKR